MNGVRFLGHGQTCGIQQSKITFLPEQAGSLPNFVPTFLRTFRDEESRFAPAKC